MIYENCTIVTVDTERRIITDGALAVTGGKLAAVGKREQVIRECPQDSERYDLRGQLVIPGLVNTHVHLSQA